MRLLFSYGEKSLLLSKGLTAGPLSGKQLPD